MWILAITKVRSFCKFDLQLIRKERLRSVVISELIMQIRCDRLIVIRGPVVCPSGKPGARLERKLSLVCRELTDNGGIELRVGHNGDVAPIPRCGADHRRSADVNVLNRFLEIDAVFSDRPFERIQIYDDEIDRLDPMGA